MQVNVSWMCHSDRAVCALTSVKLLHQHGAHGPRGEGRSSCGSCQNNNQPLWFKYCEKIHALSQSVYCIHDNDGRGADGAGMFHPQRHSGISELWSLIFTVDEVCIWMYLSRLQALEMFLYLCCHKYNICANRKWKKKVEKRHMKLHHALCCVAVLDRGVRCIQAR